MGIGFWFKFSLPKAIGSFRIQAVLDVFKLALCYISQRHIFYVCDSIEGLNFKISNKLISVIFFEECFDILIYNLLIIFREWFNISWIEILIGEVVIGADLAVSEHFVGLGAKCEITSFPNLIHNKTFVYTLRDV